MKKSLLVLLAAVLLVLPTMAQKERTNFAPAKSVQFGQVSPFNMTTRTGESINMQNILSQGKTIIIDLSCCWCGPCWSLHQSGVLEYLHQTYGAPGSDEFFIIWAEVESTNTDAQITGTSVNGNRDGLTQGDWTNGGTVPYAIVDDATIPGRFALYGNTVPTVFMIFPNGYYRDITYEIRSGSTAAQCAANVYALKDYYPQAGVAPIIELTGPTAVINGSNATYSVDVLSVDALTGISWEFEDGTPASASNTQAASTMWSTSGDHNVIVTVSNTSGSTSDTLVVNTYDCQAITSLPETMDFSDGMGCWSMYSADPANDDMFGIQELNDGSYCFLFSSYNEASNYNQYLISPELQLNADFALSFYYLSYQGAPEQFKVVYSTTDNNPQSFTHVIADITATNNQAFLEYSGVIPAEAKYVAINYYANYQYYLMITDIVMQELTAPSVTIEAPATAFVNSPVTFNAIASMAEDYIWTVDGNPVNVNNSVMEYTFSTTGNHTVAVTVNNSVGSDNASATINIKNYGDTLYYDNGTFASSIGAGGSINWGIVLDPTMLSNRNTITDVAFYVAYAGTYSIKVSEGSATAPQTVLCTQNVNASSNDEDNWKYVHLNNTVTFNNAKHLWVTLSNSGVDYPAAGCAYTGNPNGSMVSTDGTNWMPIQQASSSLNYTWMIRAIVPYGIGINDIDNNVAIYPNPASDKLNVVAEGVKNIEIIDATGRVVLNTKSAGSINISSLSNGIYMVRTITNEGVSMQKIIKK